MKTIKHTGTGRERVVSDADYNIIMANPLVSRVFVEVPTTPAEEPDEVAALKNKNAETGSKKRRTPRKPRGINGAK